MNPLSQRQQAILNRVVDTHIETAQPVGSRFITNLYTELYRDSYSPATVRHEMGLLEDLGYLTHPHTSAGRIPTDQGYRYYVDHSLQTERIAENWSDLQAESEEDLDALIEKACELLTHLSGELGVVIMERKKPGTRFHVQGTSQILEKPEFQDRERIKQVFRALEEKKAVTKWLQAKPQQGVSISIGKENEHDAFHHCSVISIRYSTGVLALIGPKRMRYSKTIPLVENMGKMLNQIFSELA